MPGPERIGKYEILERVGGGGMGVVYKARNTNLGRMVAVKVITRGLSDTADGRERLLREARAVSMLQHANIVVVHELGEHESNPFIVMEFLDGEPLDRVIQARTPLSLVQKIDIVVQVSKALQYAHLKGILPVGQYSLGNMYFKGWGLPQDYAQAAQWFPKRLTRATRAPSFSWATCTRTVGALPKMTSRRSIGSTKPRPTQTSSPEVRRRMASRTHLTEL